MRHNPRLMLLLFDIDGTLLLTRGAGLAAMEKAGRDLFGADFRIDGVSFAGRLDPLIFQDLAARNGVEASEHFEGRFFEAYRKELAELLGNGMTSEALPGVVRLIEALRRTENVTLGLLTGNYATTGRLKIRHAGLDPDLFEICVWGTDGQCRSALPPVAMNRYEELKGRKISPEDVVIIGDTPHDVSCALDNGCRVLAVATGRYDESSLREAGADIVLSNLAECETVVHWIFSRGEQR